MATSIDTRGKRYNCFNYQFLACYYGIDEDACNEVVSLSSIALIASLWPSAKAIQLNIDRDASDARLRTVRREAMQLSINRDAIDAQDCTLA